MISCLLDWDDDGKQAVLNILTTRKVTPPGCKGNYIQEREDKSVH